MVVPPTPLLLIAPLSVDVGRQRQGGGGGDGPEKHPYGTTMPPMEIRRRVSFLRR